MFALRKSKESAASLRPERAGGLGTVRCPRCESRIEIVTGPQALAEEFSVRCAACHSRSFHMRHAIASGVAVKSGG